MKFDQGFTFLIVSASLPCATLEQPTDTFIQLLAFRHRELLALIIG